MTPSSAYSRLARQSAPSRTTTDPCTPCPVCGGLECLCRPRFFAGQLLTEADLNRLDHYIVAKNRLHNRYIHGWGVACGLEVVCHPCENTVLVRPGYALSPCGDDIIVCNETGVDVCALIDACCRPREDQCQPFTPPPAECAGVEQQWILAICYDEKPTRGSAALRASSDSPCCSRCACGGSGSCGCGCHGKAKTNGNGTTPTKKSPPQCEPTILCETYHFVVYPVKSSFSRATPRGAMVDRFLQCFQRYLDAVPAVPQGNFTVAQVLQWCTEFRQALVDLLADSSVTNCELLSKLNGLCPPPPANITPQAYLVMIAQNLAPFVVEYVRACICSALLPPCPDPVVDACVPLATITIRKQDCKILRICNLEGRKFLTTFPNLQYWLSWLPFVRNIRQLLTRLCCTIVQRPSAGFSSGVRPNFPTAAQTVSASRQTAGIGTITATSFRKAATAAPKGVAALAYASMGLNDEKNRAFISTGEVENPLAMAIADELLAPVVGDFFPAGTLEMFRAAGGADAARYAEAERKQEAEVSELRATVANLQQMLDKQQATIDGLVSRLPRTGPAGGEK